MIDDETIKKLVDFAKKTASHMHEVSVTRSTIGEYNVVIHTDEKGFQLVEKFLTSSPVNALSFLNIIKSQRDGIKRALELSQGADKAANLNEPSELTKVLDEVHNPPKPDVIVTDKLPGGGPEASA